MRHETIATRLLKLEKAIAKIKKANAKKRHPHPRPHQPPKIKPPWRDESKIRRLRRAGFSDVNIGRELGCSLSTANRWRHRFGVHDSLSSKRWS